MAKSTTKEKLESGRALLSIVAMVLAVIYLISPIDIIPDVIPVIGFLDDLIVLALAGLFLMDTIRS